MIAYLSKSSVFGLAIALSIVCLTVVPMSAWAQTDTPEQTNLPNNMIFFTKGTICPPGSRATTAASGRLLLGIVHSDVNGISRGDALSDKEDRKHSHQIRMEVVIPHKRIFAANSCCNEQATNKGAHASDPITVDDTTTGLPFIQLLACTVE